MECVPSTQKFTNSKHIPKDWLKDFYESCCFWRQSERGINVGWCISRENHSYCQKRDFVAKNNNNAFYRCFLSWTLTLGPLYTKSQDHKQLGPNNSILDLRRYFLKVHLGPNMEIWFQKLYEVFYQTRTKKLEPKWCRVGAKLFCNTLDSTPKTKHLGPIFSFPPIILPTNNIAY